MNDGTIRGVGCFGIKEGDSGCINLFFVSCIGTRNIFGGNVCLKCFAAVGKIIDPDWVGMAGEAFLKAVEVVYNFTTAPCRVVTVHFERRLRGKL